MLNSFDTMQIHPWTQPQNKNSIQIKSQGAHNKCFPIGLTFVDVDRKENVRVTTFVDSLTEVSAEVHIESWYADTGVLYSARCIWLEISPDDHDLQCGSFDTLEVRPWDKPQLSTTRYIQFPEPYDSPPHVVVWLKKLDLDRFCNSRIKAAASDITNTGFIVRVDTWGDSVVFQAAVSWISHPSDCPNITSGSFNTTDVRPSDQPRLTTESKVDFGKTFKTTPRVFAALNTLDVGNAANLRIKLETKDISSSNMAWSIDTWGDTLLYSAGASYLAIQDP